MRGFLVFLIFLPLLVFGGTFLWVAASQPKQAEAIAVKVELPQIGSAPQSDDPLVKKGWETFNAKGCVFCHGPNGQGGVANNNAQGGKIPALTKVYEGYSKDELKEKIRRGVPEPGKADPKGPPPPLYMPSWKDNLTPDELDAIVAFLFSYKPKGGGGEEW